MNISHPSHRDGMNLAQQFIAGTYFHYIFSTKNQQKIIKDGFRERLWTFMGGIARKNGIDALAIGGVEDHAHLLLSIPPRLSIAEAIKLINEGSSHWVHDTFPRYKDFKWQEGYGVFSVSRSKLDELEECIDSQKEHHQKRGFREEYVTFLVKHGIKYDNRYIWG